jgi:hypothetical protein
MNKINIQIPAQLKFRNKTVFVLFTVNTVTDIVLQCFLYAHAFKMASFVTLLLYCFITKLFFSISAILSATITLKHSFCLALIFSGNDSEIW